MRPPIHTHFICNLACPVYIKPPNDFEFVEKKVNSYWIAFPTLPSIFFISQTLKEMNWTIVCFILFASYHSTCWPTWFILLKFLAPLLLMDSFFYYMSCRIVRHCMTYILCLPLVYAVFRKKTLYCFCHLYNRLLFEWHCDNFCHRCITFELCIYCWLHARHLRWNPCNSEIKVLWSQGFVPTAYVIKISVEVEDRRFRHLCIINYFDMTCFTS